jgi:hypothetical protein
MTKCGIVKKKLAKFDTHSILDPRLWLLDGLYFHSLPTSLRGSSPPKYQQFIPDPFQFGVTKNRVFRDWVKVS